MFCADTGYQGRIGVYELLVISDQMKQLVVTEPKYQDLRDLAVAEGMVPLQTEALRLVERDVTTIDEVSVRYADGTVVSRWLKWQSSVG